MKFKSIFIIALFSPQLLIGTVLKKVSDDIVLKDFYGVSYVNSESALAGVSQQYQKFINDLPSKNALFKGLKGDFNNLLEKHLRVWGERSFDYPEGFTSQDYMELVYTEERLRQKTSRWVQQVSSSDTVKTSWILRSRLPGDINADPKNLKLPNFDIQNPNFVVIDQLKYAIKLHLYVQRPKSYVERDGVTFAQDVASQITFAPTSIHEEGTTDSHTLILLDKSFIEVSLPHFIWNIDKPDKRVIPQDLQAVVEDARKLLYSEALIELKSQLMLLGNE